MFSLETKNITLAYNETNIIENLNFQIPKGKITVLIGSNGSGKSTLLKAMARLLKPKEGHVIINGKDIHSSSTKKVARQLAILPQSPVTPEGLTVLQLVKQGRYPYQNWLQQWSKQDEDAVQSALEATRLVEFVDRPVESLSGGQRQRAWIAMALAQNTDTILLDEPTTYLDLAHQIEVLDLLYDLNQTEQRTIVMVLHDLNLACRYADHIVAVHNKGIYDQGAPEQIITPNMVKDVFGLEAQVSCDPMFGTPLCIPCGKGRRVNNAVRAAHA
ncbi:ABC transporter ATP-binding protein [Alkalihalobacillus sp. AL-G]|uniref:ABC transporter ATP-binding protein n=1 Tax=Alkalihalobacillus sp. AL-G TaxID=2926399 RepID=UPI00272CE34B|nr:ABC transporter ATP-binding protein [Alkalihalobacillus sp. AL-G]WLD94155.1 ABC transporter ATP-binding protein [Alkalihalobacillus sp. AL-G]